MRLIPTSERPPTNPWEGRRNGQLGGGTDYFGFGVFPYFHLLRFMVTTKVTFIGYFERSNATDKYYEIYQFKLGRFSFVLFIKQKDGKRFI